MEIATVHGTIPATENGTVVPFPREQRRTPSYLTEAEVERLMQAVRKHCRYGHRGAAMILVAYRHGLRVGELVRLQWTQVHFESATLHVRRLKHGKPSSHPLSGNELRALRKLRREQPARPDPSARIATSRFESPQGLRR